MEISDVLSLDCTACAIQISSKKKVLESIARVAHQKAQYIDINTVLSSIFDREKKGSTGIGQGIAIPHGRISGLEKAVAVLMTTESPIPFDAIDNEPVDVFFALLVPSCESSNYLEILSNVAGKLNTPAIVQKIRKAKTPNELYEALA